MHVEVHVAPADARYDELCLRGSHTARNQPAFKCFHLDLARGARTKHVRARQVHNGVGFVEDDSNPLRLNNDCGFMLHVLNQFGFRDFDEATVTDTSWQWALNGTF